MKVRITETNYKACAQKVTGSQFSLSQPKTDKKIIYNALFATSADKEKKQKRHRETETDGEKERERERERDKCADSDKKQ